MDEQGKKKICHQKGCKILEGGSCLEGIDTNQQECPHFYFEDETTTIADSVAEKQEVKKIGIQLFTGAELSLPETALVTNKFDSTLVVIIGESKSGKTTLLAEYFINFQKGPFKNFSFAGSLTQVGFEQRCFLATLGSRAKKPDTFKTGSMEFNFLHLALKNNNLPEQEIRHLLLSDISGERYREAKKSSTLMKGLKIVRQADFVLFMIDGHKVAAPATRAVTIDNAKTFIQMALDNDVFDSNTKLKVAMSKWDYLEDDSTFSFEERIEKAFTDQFASRLGSLEFTKIASRTHKQSVPAGLGMHKLLEEWCHDSTSIGWRDLEFENRSERYFAKLKLREQ